MQVAAYQAPLAALGCDSSLSLVRERISWCEAVGVSVLCCPEAILGGLADYGEPPHRFAIRADNGQLDAVLRPLASNAVTTIAGFTELRADGAIYNAAAVFQEGRVVGLYRKLHPAIRRSVYAAGSETPVFRVGELIFGVVICNDSNYAEPARLMAAQGAAALFVPTNNALPKDRPGLELVEAARRTDVARAVENRMWVVRADVAGQAGELMSYGSSEIVGPDGHVVVQAKLESTDLLVADVPIAQRLGVRPAVRCG